MSFGKRSDFSNRGTTPGAAGLDSQTWESTMFNYQRISSPPSPKLRDRRPIPSTRAGSILRPAITLAAMLLVVLPAAPQYPGQVAKNSKSTPELRAISVLEWTGEPGKPRACRMVPVAVLDDGELQDGSIYLARPQPLALAGEVEYELQQNGKPIGLFDVENTGQEQGSWVGYGKWKGVPAAKPAPSREELAHTRLDDDFQSDGPVLHRKHHADDPPATGQPSNSGAGASDSSSTAPTPPTDPDRPTLHKKDSSASADDSSAPAPTTGTVSDSGQPTLHRRDSTDSASNTGAPATTPAPPTDPDRPTLHKKPSDDASSGSSAPDSDPDRPVLKKTKKKKQEDVGYSEGIAGVTDPDRPHLKRGLSSSDVLKVAPSLMGLPPDMEQAVAVSDAKVRPEHPWSFTWANPDDESKMRSSLEEIARDALGLNPPPPPPAPAPKRATTRKNAKPALPPPVPEPAPLVDEQFRVFELTYGSGATLVLTARSGGPLEQQKFVTLIAQPDLYGNTLVLLKSVTDGGHLDEVPRMRLVDAVDALADNRGELLFELRGKTQRQFALYRVLRGQAEKLFVGGGGEFIAEARN